MWTGALTRSARKSALADPGHGRHLNPCDHGGLYGHENVIAVLRFACSAGVPITGGGQCKSRSKKKGALRCLLTNIHRKLPLVPTLRRYRGSRNLTDPGRCHGRFGPIRSAPSPEAGKGLWHFGNRPRARMDMLSNPDPIFVAVSCD